MIAEDTIAWEVIGQGIREVLVRCWPVPGAIAAVSRRGGPLIGNGQGGLRAWAPHTTHPLASDLFATEELARAEFHRRRDASRCKHDLRFLKEPFHAPARSISSGAQA